MRGQLCGGSLHFISANEINAQFLLCEVHGYTGVSIILQDDAYIYMVFQTHSYKNRQLLLHQNTENQERQCFPTQIVFWERDMARVHRPPINTIIPTLNLLICSPRFSPFLGSGSHPGGERCCKDEITGTSRSARPRIAEMTPFFAELYVPAIKIRNLHSNTQLHVASTQI